MEQQIKETFHKAFSDILESNAEKGDVTYIEKLVDEMIERLCRLVPSRTDIHKKLKDDIKQNIDYSIQLRIINWVEKFQAPTHDKKTKKIKTELPKKISEFVKEFHEHLDMVENEIIEAKQKIHNGENIFNAEKPQSSNGITPDNLRSGR